MERVPVAARATPVALWSRLLADALLAPTPRALRRWAAAGLITSVLIILTGAAVRLSQSGLGCPDWPDCTATSLAASGTTGDPLIHRWVEFGNRLMTVAIFVVAIGVFVAAWQYKHDGRRRRDLVWLAAAQPAGIVAQAVLGGLVVLTILTGAAVRLSQSGLGCPDWPDCTATSLAASGTTGDPLIHRWVEFGNRLVTVAIFVVAVGVFVAAWRYKHHGRRRRDLVWLAAAQPAGIVAQAVLGGLVVLTKLNPALVSAHFLASVALVAATVALYLRCQEREGPARPLVPRPVRLMAFAVVGAVALMMAAGTVVTGTGPLAGARGVARYRLPLEGVTQLHADIGWLLGGLVVALLLGLRLGGAPRHAVRLGWLLAGLVAIQGTIGYAQYFSGLPAGLVWVHVAGSVAIWLAALFLPYTLRDRGAQPAELRSGPLAEHGADASVPR